jgi:hypothetical protein
MSATMLPPRTLQQRMEALAKGNDHRTRRARLKRDIATGQRKIYDVLLSDVPEWAATMPIGALLRSTPGVGQVKRDKMLRSVGISPAKTLAGLTVRQRSELAGTLRETERRVERRRAYEQGLAA